MAVLDLPHLSGAGPRSAVERWRIKGRAGEVGQASRGKGNIGSSATGRLVLVDGSQTARLCGGGGERADGGGQQPPALCSSLCLCERGVLCTGGTTGQQRPSESFAVKPAVQCVLDLARESLTVTLDVIRALVRKEKEQRLHKLVMTFFFAL